MTLFFYMLTLFFKFEGQKSNLECITLSHICRCLLQYFIQLGVRKREVTRFYYIEVHVTLMKHHYIKTFITLGWQYII
jgi:hypothetical protein